MLLAARLYSCVVVVDLVAKVAASCADLFGGLVAVLDVTCCEASWSCEVGCLAAVRTVDAVVLGGHPAVTLVDETAV